MNENDVKKIDNNTILHIRTNTHVTRQLYTNLWNECKERDYTDFYNKLNKDFECDIYKVKDEIDDIALSLQICYKHHGSRMLYLHGFVLYAALTKYIKNNPDIEKLTIIETGTARGFSSLCMAKALYDNKKKGKIYTIDIFSSTKKMYWNCIADLDGKHSLRDIVLPWKNLVDKYVVFINGYTTEKLPLLINSLDRVHFSFLDAQHDYKNLIFELQNIKKIQEKGDIIICDDYTFYRDGRMQYPGIQRAIDEFVRTNEYESKIYYADDGQKKRGYVWFKKKTIKLKKKNY